MLLIMWGFATAFYIALRRDQDAQEVCPGHWIDFGLQVLAHQLTPDDCV